MLTGIRTIYIFFDPESQIWPLSAYIDTDSVEHNVTCADDVIMFKWAVAFDNIVNSQLTFTCLKSPISALRKGRKYVQN